MEALWKASSGRRKRNDFIGRSSKWLHQYLYAKFFKVKCWRPFVIGQQTNQKFVNFQFQRFDEIFPLNFNFLSQAKSLFIFSVLTSFFPPQFQYSLSKQTFVYFQLFDEFFSLNFNFPRQTKSLFIFSVLMSFSLSFNFFPVNQKVCLFSAFWRVFSLNSFFPSNHKGCLSTAFPAISMFPAFPFPVKSKVLIYFPFP